MGKYIRHWGVYVGTFDEEQLMNNEDDVAIEKAMIDNPNLKYINSREIKKNGTRKLAIYICSLKDLRLSFK